METITTMLNSISKRYEQQKKLEEKKREQGDFFNVFNTIGLRTEEVRLHSAFIAELLNPKGSHGLSQRFLQAFLEVIGVQDDYFDYRRCPCGIITERWIGPKTEIEGGQIDIIIEDGKHAIIIENKIYAGDQTNQMLRYNNYGRKKFPDGYKLMYLTLDGHEPDKCSVGNAKFDYKTISYGNEIAEWLEKCYTISEGKPLVQSVIKQYCELVKQITNTDMDTTYKNKLMSIMLAPENVTAVGEVLQLQDEWFSRVLDEYIWKPLESFAKSIGMRFGKSDGAAWIYREEWQYYKLFIWTDSNCCRDMYVGVSWYEDKPGRKNLIFKKDWHQLNCLTSLEPNEEWPYGREYLPDDIRGWGYFNIDKIVNKEVFNYIKKKFEGMISEIDELQLRMP